MTLTERLTGSSSSTAPGAEAIVDAIYGGNDPRDTSTAVAGEPELRNFGSEHMTDYRIVVPLESIYGVQLPEFVFDVPDGLSMAGEFGDFLRDLGYNEVEDIVAIAGTSVPIRWEGGVPVPDF